MNNSAVNVSPLIQSILGCAFYSRQLMHLFNSTASLDRCPEPVLAPFNNLSLQHEIVNSAIANFEDCTETFARSRALVLRMRSHVAQYRAIYPDSASVPHTFVSGRSPTLYSYLNLLRAPVAHSAVPALLLYNAEHIRSYEYLITLNRLAGDHTDVCLPSPPDVVKFDFQKADIDQLYAEQKRLSEEFMRQYCRSRAGSPRLLSVFGEHYISQIGTPFELLSQQHPTKF